MCAQLPKGLVSECFKAVRMFDEDDTGVNWPPGKLVRLALTLFCPPCISTSKIIAGVAQISKFIEQQSLQEIRWGENLDLKRLVEGRR